METWKMQRSNSILCAGRRRSGWRKRRGFLSPPPPSRSEERFMPPRRDFRGGKGTWLSSRQNLAKMSGGLNKGQYERRDATCIRLYELSWNRFFMILYTRKRFFLLRLFLKKKDKYYCQQLLMHKQGLSKVWKYLVPCPSEIK